MPATRQQRLNAIEEEQLALNSEGRSSLLNTNLAHEEEGAVNDKIAFLQQEMAKISDQLSRLSANSTGNDNNNRATTSAEDVLRSLQTPSTLRDLIPFDGNPIKLHQFLKAVDRVMPIMQQAKNSPMFDVWMQAIRSKIIGDADTVLELYGTELEWDEIKNNLIAHYHDKRDEVSLTRDLFKLSQTGTVQELYESISYIISLLVNQLNLNENDANVKSAKQKYYQEIGLKVFVAGLRAPLGPIIRAQQPRTLKEALRFCTEENNYNYVQNNSLRVQTPSTSNTGAMPKQNSSQYQKPQYRAPIQQPYRAQSNPNQSNLRPSYPPPPNTSGYNHKPPYYNNSYAKVNQGTNAASDPAPVPQAPHSNFHKQNQYRKPPSGRTHTLRPNFHVEEEVSGYDYCPNNDEEYNDGAYYYEEHDPCLNNSQSPQTTSTPKPSDTHEDELNFHIAEQAVMKR